MASAFPSGALPGAVFDLATVGKKTDRGEAKVRIRELKIITNRQRTGIANPRK